MSVGDEIGAEGAVELGCVKNGMKVTTPRVKSFLKSKIVWFMAWASVVPHQLSVAFTLEAVVR